MFCINSKVAKKEIFIKIGPIPCIMRDELAKAITEDDKKREIYREKISRVLSEVGAHYRERGVAELELHQGHDVHAFYRLTADPSRAIHVQGYPGMSSEEKMKVAARLMDHAGMMEIRLKGTVSVGNEHEATVERFSNFELGIDIPYDAEVLEDILAENLPELKKTPPPGVL